MAIKGSKKEEGRRLPSYSNESGHPKIPSISYYRLFRFSTQLDRILIGVGLLFTIISAVTLPYAITLVANVFQLMIDYDRSKGSKNTNSTHEFISSMNTFSIAYSSIGVALFAGGYFGTAFLNIAAINQVFKIREAYLEAAMNQDFGYYDTHSSGDLASKMTSDLIKLEDGIGDKLSSVVYNLVVALGCMLMSFVKGWKLSLLCMIVTPVTFLLVGVTGTIAHYLSKKVAVQTGKASEVAEEVLSSIQTVIAFNGQEKEINRYADFLTKARTIELRKDFFTGLSMAFLFLCIFCSYGLSFYFGVYLIIQEPHNYDANVMFSVFFGIITGLGNLGVVGSLYASFGSARGAAAGIFHMIDYVPMINPLLESGLRPKTVVGTLELKNVWFNYPSRDKMQVLRNFNLKVERGQSVALVGMSGCGKSTVISLVCRFYDATAGSVLLDGIDVRRLSVKWLRSQIGLVEQEPVLFNTSILENIRYGREDATDDDIKAAAKRAYAHDFISSLPNAYATRVGEGGMALSGGQKQRIAIARALIREPPILLLDEATSALDTSSENKVLYALAKAAEGRTTLIVAHRLSTIRNVDMICVLHEGQVVESGKHDELVQLKGQYYNMLLLQDPLLPELTEELSPNLGMETATSKTSVMTIKSLFSVQEELAAKLKVPFWSVVKLNAPEWKSLIVGGLCSVLIGFSMPVFVLIFGSLFGTMSDTNTDVLMSKVTTIAAICAIVGCVVGLTHLVENMAFGIAGAYLTHRLRLRMFAHLLNQDAAFFDDQNNSTGALCARLSSEASYVQGATGSRLSLLLQSFGGISLGIIFAMIYEWRVGMIVLCFIPLIGVVMYFETKATLKESFGNAKSLQSSTMLAVEAMLNIRTVVALGRESRVLEEYVRLLRTALEPAHAAAHLRGLVSGMSRSMFNFINAAALVYGTKLIVNEDLPYQTILIVTQCLQIASSHAQNAFAFVPDIQRGSTAAARALALLKHKNKITDPENPIPFINPIGSACFREVSFRYPSRPDTNVLQNFDLMINSGKNVALVGESGCGKSTVIKLLLRFYDPDRGHVELDGIPLQTMRLDVVRANYGLVSQEPVLFDRTIADNIAYGNNLVRPSMKEIMDAAELANIHSFIENLPLGYDTTIGSHGVQLSGGQKQRIAIARALVRNPRILLLDEATSALDTESEKVVQQALDKARIGRTCVTIAHRLSTVRNADVICVVENGSVAETGTHDELMEAQGVYYKLRTNASFMPSERRASRQPDDKSTGNLQSPASQNKLTGELQRPASKNEPTGDLQGSPTENAATGATQGPSSENTSAGNTQGSPSENMQSSPSENTGDTQGPPPESTPTERRDPQDPPPGN